MAGTAAIAAIAASRFATRALLVWCVLLVLAVGNGVLREAVLAPAFGAVIARALSGVLLSVLVLVVAAATHRWLGACRAAQCWRIGLGWLGLTLAFETALGVWRGASMHALLQSYAFDDGNLWPLVLLVIVCAPWIASRVRPASTSMRR